MPKVSLNAPAPDFTLQDFRGKTVRLSDFRGKANVMLVLLGTLIITYLRLGIGRAAVSLAETWLARVPFSIYLGWITVATIANATALLDYWKWDGFGIAPEVWMGIMLVAVLAIAVLVIFTRRDIAYTLVILWALAGISIKHAAVSAVAIPTWITFGLVALGLAAALFMRRPQADKLRRA